MIADRIYEDNLRSFLTVLGWIIEYDFGEDDWQNVGAGVRKSDGEIGHWFDYEFTGRHEVKLHPASDPGSSVVRIRLEIPDMIQPEEEVAISIFQYFHLTPGSH